MTTEHDYGWLRVSCRAQVNEDSSDKPVAEGVEEILERREVGIASSTAALEYLTSSEETLHETSLSAPSIGMAYGYPLHVDYERFARVPYVRVWTPKRLKDCDDIMRSLSRIDPNIYSRKYVNSALRNGFGEPGHTIYAVGDRAKPEAKGILVMDREIEFYEDRASIYYHVRVCHSEGTVHQTAALQAALYYQARADFECAVLSMQSAGLTPKLDMVVFVEDDDDGMYSGYVEQLEYARDDAFTYGKVPEWLDLDAFGPWATGTPDRVGGEPHVVVRSADVLRP